MTNPIPETHPLVTKAEDELKNALEWWSQGKAGRGRVGSRRAAGMVLRYWLEKSQKEGYGTSFMHHLNGAADDPSLPDAVRCAAWRLAARQPPEGGWPTPLPSGLTPMMDARLIIDWCLDA